MPALFEAPTAECLIYDQAIENAMSVIARVVMREEDYLAQSSFWGIHIATRRMVDSRLGGSAFFVFVAAPSEDRLKILLRLSEGAAIDSLWRLKSTIPRTEIVDRLRDRLRELDAIRWGIEADLYDSLKRSAQRWERAISLGRCGMQTIMEALAEVQQHTGGAVRAAAARLRENIRNAEAGTALSEFYAGINTERPDWAPHPFFGTLWCRRVHPNPEDQPRKKFEKHERLVVFEQGMAWVRGNERRPVPGSNRFILWIDTKTPPENFGVSKRNAMFRRERLFHIENKPS